MKEQFKPAVVSDTVYNNLPKHNTNQFFTQKMFNTEEEFWDNQSTLPGYQGVTVDDENNSSTTALYNYLNLEFDFTNKTIIDIGCGVGRLFPIFLDSQAAAINGVDFSLGMLKIARFKYPYKHIGIYKLSADNLIEFGDGSHDVSMVCCVLGHIVDTEQLANTIKEICRVTKKDGIIIVIDTLTTTGFKCFNHSRLVVRPKSFITSLFEANNVSLFSQGRECFGHPEKPDSFKSILVYEK